MKLDAEKTSGPTSGLASIGKRYQREASAAIAYVVLLAIVAFAAPGFYSPANLRDLAIVNAPALIVAIAMTMFMSTWRIDSSVGSQFAVCSVADGLLAKGVMPIL